MTSTGTGQPICSLSHPANNNNQITMVKTLTSYSKMKQLKDIQKTLSQLKIIFISLKLWDFSKFLKTFTKKPDNTVDPGVLYIENFACLPSWGSSTPHDFYFIWQCHNILVAISTHCETSYCQSWMSFSVALWE